MKERKIIAILGLPGSGKTEAISHLMKKFNWPKVYFGDVTFDELKKRGMEINEKNERTVREDLREKHGRLHYADQVLKKIEDLGKDTNILVESLYDWDEYLLFKKTFGDSFVAIVIYAPPKVRYERLAKRLRRPLNMKEAQERDYAQIGHLRQGGPIAIADYTVENTGTPEDLYNKIDEIIKKVSEL